MLRFQFEDKMQKLAQMGNRVFGLPSRGDGTMERSGKRPLDVDEDGSVDIRDATYIMLYIVNQPSSEAKVGQYTGGIAPPVQ